MRENVAQPQVYSVPGVEVRSLLRSVYLWITLGLLITAVSWCVYSVEAKTNPEQACPKAY